MIDVNKILFHPSANGRIMTGVKKGWSVEKSLTCKRELISIYRQLKYSRKHHFTNKYVEKGLLQEEDGITLYSSYRKKKYIKNKVTLTNAYFEGTPDIIDEGEETIDTKCVWSLDTLPHKLVDDVDSDYEYQGDGYVDLTGVKRHIVVYCLVNAPASLILREKEMLWYKMGQPTNENQDYMDACISIEKNMIFDLWQFKYDNKNFDLDCKDWHYDIPMNERIVEFVLPRNDAQIQQIKNRIDDCRAWMEVNLNSRNLNN